MNAVVDRTHQLRWVRGTRATLPTFVAVLSLCCGRPSMDSPETTPAPPDQRAVPTVPAPEQTATLFEDVTDRAGLDFTHDPGTTGAYLLPEITGSGGALFDFDGDGDLDLYVVQGAALELADGTRTIAAPSGPRVDRLYRNELDAAGAVHFVDVTTASGIVAPGYGMGVAVGDYDNDGRPDLYVTNLGSNQLWHNLGDGRFRDVTVESRTDDPGWSTSATWLDVDRDGWLDLFVTRYVEFDYRRAIECFAASSARDFCGPDAYPPTHDRLFRNRGDGTFDDITDSSGIATARGAGLGVVAADLDADGWLDLYVANDGDPNQLWINQQGSGRFVDGGLLAGVAVNGVGRAEAGMGVDVGDVDGDGDDDIFLSHLDGESNTLYENDGGGLFTDRTVELGLHQASLPYTGFGAGLIDCDNDGWLDLFVANGAVRVQDRASADRGALGQENLLFRNLRGKGFERVTKGTGMSSIAVSRGAAFGDVDNDGDVDVVVFDNGGATQLYLNAVGQRGSWIGIVAREHGRAALGASIDVERANGRELRRRVHRDGSYASSSDPRVIVGLEADASPVTVRVTWSDGASEQFDRLSVGQYWLIPRDGVPRLMKRGE